MRVGDGDDDAGGRQRSIENGCLTVPTGLHGAARFVADVMANELEQSGSHGEAVAVLAGPGDGSECLVHQPDRVRETAAGLGQHGLGGQQMEPRYRALYLVRTPRQQLHLATDPGQIAELEGDVDTPQM